MSTAADRYLDLISGLRFARLERELDGATLSQCEEREYIDALDSFWNEMDHDEQERIESLLRDRMPNAPSELEAKDTDVDVGGQAGPRREAA
jgi:hypothetical protein